MYQKLHLCSTYKGLDEEGEAMRRGGDSWEVQALEGFTWQKKLEPPLNESGS